MRRVGLMQFLDWTFQFILFILGLVSMLILSTGKIYTAILLVFAVYLLMFIQSRIKYLNSRFAKNDKSRPNH